MICQVNPLPMVTFNCFTILLIIKFKQTQKIIMYHVISLSYRLFFFHTDVRQTKSLPQKTWIKLTVFSGRVQICLFLLRIFVNMLKHAVKFHIVCSFFKTYFLCHCINNPILHYATAYFMGCEKLLVNRTKSNKGLFAFTYGHVFPTGQH